MTNLEVQTFLVNSVLRRQGDTDFTVAQALINLAHLELQRMRDWGCMESHQLTNYAAAGIAIAPATIKRVDAVYQSTVNSTTGLTVRGREIVPTTREMAQGAALDGRYSRPWPYGDGVIPPNGVGYDGEHWFIQEDTLFVNNDALIGVQLWIDKIVFLTDYAANGDRDWFSDLAWDALVWKAAAMGSIVGWEDDRYGMFEQMAAAKIEQARMLDIGNREAGTSPMIRAPVVGYRMGR